jgi:hypothetical protein
LDENQLQARRALARRLLAQGVKPLTVAQQLGVGRSWVYRLRDEIRAEAKAEAARRKWDGTERRKGEERRGTVGPPSFPRNWSRRTGKDRRGASIVARATDGEAGA